MPITDKKLWDNQVEINTDPYGACIVNVARRVMELLDEDHIPLSKEHRSADNMINQADVEVNAGGITGFQANAVSQIVSACHSRGEEFRRGWNSEYRYDGDGVVNPAIITIET